MVLRESTANNINNGSCNIIIKVTIVNEAEYNRNKTTYDHNDDENRKDYNDNNNF